MLTTFERYILSNFLSVVVLCLTAVLGLFIVIDLFDNVDDFIKKDTTGGLPGIVHKIISYYSFMGLFVFDSTASALMAISLIIVLIMLQRRSQLKPLVAAGHSTHRILVPPLLVGIAIVSGLRVANREFILDSNSHRLHADRNSNELTSHGVNPIYDLASNILIDGESVIPQNRTMKQATFVLPEGRVSDQLTCIHAEEAVFHPQLGKRPAGWLLLKPTPGFNEISLTEHGRKFLYPGRTQEEIFIASDLTPELLYNGKNTSNYLATSRIVKNIRSPAFDEDSIRKLQYLFHARLLEPFMAIAAVFVVIPMMVKKDSRSMVLNSASCCLTLGVITGVQECCRFLQSAAVLTPELAAWVPFTFCCLCAAWMTPLVET